jgi:hypothetical protein
MSRMFQMTIKNEKIIYLIHYILNNFHKIMLNFQILVHNYIFVEFLIITYMLIHIILEL